MKEKLIFGLQTLRVRAKEWWQLFRAWVEQDRRRAWVVGGLVLIFAIYACSRSEEKVHYVYQNKDAQFSQARVLENPYKHIADNKIEMVEESEERLRADNRELKSKMSEIIQTLGELKAGLNRAPQAEKQDPVKDQPPKPPETTKLYGGAPHPPGDVQGAKAPHGSGSLKPLVGPFSVFFPVPVKRTDKNTGVVIPSGSYVKAKVVSGVKVPMGETYPALLQLDYAFVKPNNRRIDLSGCFIVAKAEGDISTERLNMAPDSMSCYNRDGLFFKKDKLIGWASDPDDNDFAIRAEVDLNQGRVAQTAFAKALIDGLGASMERNTRSIGGKGIDDANPAIVLRDSGQQVGSMVADYYLTYLQGLRPTMRVGSGRDAWLILGTDVELPYQYFRKEESNASQFSYVVDLFN